jgi:hypothetical protein
MSFFPAFEHTGLLVRKIIDAGGNLSMIVRVKEWIQARRAKLGSYN